MLVQKGKQWGAAQTERDKERLTSQKGDHSNVHSIRVILSFYAAAQLQCADYESIIWDWQPCCYSTACQTHSQPPSFSFCVLPPSSHNSRLMKTEWLEEERSETWKNYAQIKGKTLFEKLVTRPVERIYITRERERERKKRMCGEHGLNAAAIKGAILCQGIC